MEKEKKLQFAAKHKDIPVYLHYVQLEGCLGKYQRNIRQMTKEQKAKYAEKLKELLDQAIDEFSAYCWIRATENLRYPESKREDIEKGYMELMKQYSDKWFNMLLAGDMEGLDEFCDKVEEVMRVAYGETMFSLYINSLPAGVYYATQDYKDLQFISFWDKAANA